jgi:hypothetical protein
MQRTAQCIAFAKKIKPGEHTYASSMRRNKKAKAALKKAVTNPGNVLVEQV